MLWVVFFFSSHLHTSVLQLSMWSTSFASMAMVSSAFGMNLTSGLETTPGAMLYSEMEGGRGTKVFTCARAVLVDSLWNGCIGIDGAYGV